MTRSPTITAMASASSCHQKLNVLELIDIAQVPKPKPESVSMDVAYRNGMSKIETRRTSESSQRGTSSNATDVESVSGNHHQALNLQSADEPPHSPAPSEISSASANTSNTSSNPTRSMTPPLTSVVGNLEQAFQTTLSAQTELLQGGCLAGDALPLRISIRHNTAVKRMQGIVITLYRQGRIDTHPAIPLGPFQKGKKAKYEDYYPKSHTGLGGLSLSSAGSSRSFRQDLNQIFAPIIVDPLSLTAIVNTSIQAPVDLFPTISGVPGAMISFKYYVEVVIDLRGKFGSQDRIRPHLSMTSGLLQGYGDPKISKVEGPGGVSYSSTPGFNFLVTDQLRRTKGVVFTRTEVIVGTLDSSRKRRKQEEDQSTVGENKSWRGSEILSIEQNRQDLEFCQTRHEDNLEVEDEGQQTVDTLGHREVFNIPPPEAEEILDEKLRLQRAEARLLPSAPPQDDGPTSSNAPLPTAPEAFDEEDFIRRYGHEAAAPAYIGVQDDKQELERQRLLRLANSPDEHEDGTEQDPPDQSPLSVQPTAPALYEDDIFDISDPRVPQFPAEHSQENNTSVGPVISNGILHHDNDIYEEGPSRSNEPNKDNLPVYRR